MPAIEPLEPSRITISAVQFVGTNVEMTYLVDVPADEAGKRLEALFAAKLGLHAITATGTADAPDGTRRPRFSVIASPLERLFHKIGPSASLTVIKHASLTLDLSETNLTRQNEGLGTRHAEASAEFGVWPTWDVGKLLGGLMARSERWSRGSVRVASVRVDPGAFPQDILPTLGAHVAEHGGVRVDLDGEAQNALVDGLV